MRALIEEIEHVVEEIVPAEEAMCAQPGAKQRIRIEDDIFVAGVEGAAEADVIVSKASYDREKHRQTEPERAPKGGAIDPPELRFVRCCQRPEEGQGEDRHLPAE